MKNITLIGLLALILVPLFFTNCEGLDESYSSNPNLNISFSTDTLSFDTVFTTVGSTTGQFMIYNHNKENLKIESLMLASGGTSGFRINLDGRKGTSFNDVSLLKDDSMYVFVEVTVNPNGVNEPLLIQDSVIAVVNGVKKSVLLQAFGQDVHLYKGGETLSGDVTLKADKPYLVYDSLVIAPNSTVRVEPGATFYMHSRANLIAHGTLLAEGTQEKPITFRGDRLDYILSNVLMYDSSPSQWGGIFFKKESFGNKMSYAIVRNGTTGITCEQSDPSQEKLSIDQSQVTNAGTNLFSAINCKVKAASSEFSNAGGNVVTLVGGSYSFAHCTLANFMILTTRGGSSSSSEESITLHILNNAKVNNSGPYPIESAVFRNCIIDGSYDVATSGGEIAITTDASQSSFSYLFDHCVLKMASTQNEHFTHNIFITESQVYRKRGEKVNKYAFDFRPDTVTDVCVGKADPTIAALYPADRYGVSRLTSSNAPTIGAYEFVKK